MVSLRTEDAGKYTFFGDYLIDEFVHVLKKPRVMEAYWKWSAFTERPEGFFMNNMPPTIWVTSYNCDYWDVNRWEKPRPGTRFKGMIDAGTYDKHYIHINSSWAVLVEDVISRRRFGKSKDGDSSILESAEAIIMHEMVHWSYFWLGYPEERRYGGDVEKGAYAFEREAYGHIVSIVDAHGKPLCYEQESYEVP